MIAKHQQQFADTARPWEGLFFGTGTGKTRTALWSVRDCPRILVIAPKTSVQKGQWTAEAVTIHMRQIPTVISKETFRRDHKILPYFDAVIFDEAHHVFGVTPNTRQRNRVRIPKASQLFEAFEWYLLHHKPTCVILATATPNKTPMGVWAAAKLLGHNWDFYQFRDKFYIRLPMPHEVYSPRRDEEAMTSLAQLTRKIGQVLRLEDIADVPAQTYLTETFELTDEQKTALKTLPARFSDASALRLKTHQIENGLLYEDVFDPMTNRVARRQEYFDNGKISRIVDLSCEFPKMVIFANYTAQIDAIADALRKEGKNVYTLTGKSKDRKETCEQAEEAPSAYIVAQASVSSEWEFKSCGVMVFASLSNRSLDYVQGIGRIQRYDAIKKNLYIHLVTVGARSVDKKWFDCIMSGKDFNEALYG